MKSWLSLENGWQIHLDTQTRAQEITLWSCNCGVFHAWQQRFLRVLQMAQNDLLKSCRAAGFSIKMGRVWMRSSTSSVFYLSYLHICVQPSQLTKSLKKKNNKKKQSNTQFNSHWWVFWASTFLEYQHDCSFFKVDGYRWNAYSLAVRWRPRLAHLLLMHAAS